MFEQAFKNLDNVLRQEAGCTTELDYTEQTSWLLFLKLHKRALALRATPGLWNERIPDLRVRVWKSPDGKRLRALMLASVSRKPATIKKSGEHREAFAALKRWQADPREGLR